MVSTFIGLLDIQSWWEIPCISHFCSLFSSAFDLPDIDIEDLESALLSDGTDEIALVPELIVRLLKGCDALKSVAKEITHSNYQMFLRRFLRQQCRIHNTENHFDTDVDFQSLPVRNRLQILHDLCHFRLDSSDVQVILSNLEADSLRVEPLGYDSKNSGYWYFYGTRLYREDKPTSTSSGNRAAAIGNNGSVWQVICFTEEDWQNLASKLKSSTNKQERELYQILDENFLPKLPQLFRERERLRRRKLLQVRNSSRIRNIVELKARQEKERENRERQQRQHYQFEPPAKPQQSSSQSRTRRRSQSTSTASGISTYASSLRRTTTTNSSEFLCHRETFCLSPEDDEEEDCEPEHHFYQRAGVPCAPVVTATATTVRRKKDTVSLSQKECVLQATIKVEPTDDVEDIVVVKEHSTHCLITCSQQLKKTSTSSEQQLPSEQQQEQIQQNRQLQAHQSHATNAVETSVPAEPQPVIEEQNLSFVSPPVKPKKSHHKKKKSQKKQKKKSREHRRRHKHASGSNNDSSNHTNNNNKDTAAVPSSTAANSKTSSNNNKKSGGNKAKAKANSKSHQSRAPNKHHVHVPSLSPEDKENFCRQFSGEGGIAAVGSDLHELNPAGGAAVVAHNADVRAQTAVVTEPVAHQCTVIKKEAASIVHDMAPATIMKLPGRQTNNSLSSLTGNIFIPPTLRDDAASAERDNHSHSNNKSKASAAATTLTTTSTSGGHKKQKSATATTSAAMSAAGTATGTEKRNSGGGGGSKKKAAAAAAASSASTSSTSKAASSSQNSEKSADENVISNNRTTTNITTTKTMITTTSNNSSTAFRNASHGADIRTDTDTAIATKTATAARSYLSSSASSSSSSSTAAVTKCYLRHANNQNQNSHKPANHNYFSSSPQNNSTPAQHQYNYHHHNNHPHSQSHHYPSHSSTYPNNSYLTHQLTPSSLKSFNYTSKNSTNTNFLSFTETEEVLQIGMHKVLVYVKNHRDAWPFMDPVEEDIAPRYYSIIRRPMDLLKMEDKLDNGEYTKFKDFRNDFKLIVNNCRLYNGHNNEYTEMVNNLQEAFDKATKKYFDNLSEDEDDDPSLGYPAADSKMNVFREKYFNKKATKENENHNTSEVDKVSGQKSSEKKKGLKKHSVESAVATEGDEDGSAGDVDKDDDVEHQQRGTKRKRKEKDKRRKKKSKAKETAEKHTDNELEMDDEENIEKLENNEDNGFEHNTRKNKCKSKVTTKKSKKKSDKSSKSNKSSKGKNEVKSKKQSKKANKSKHQNSEESEQSEEDIDPETDDDEEDTYEPSAAKKSKTKPSNNESKTNTKATMVLPKKKTSSSKSNKQHSSIKHSKNKSKNSSKSKTKSSKVETIESDAESSSAEEKILKAKVNKDLPPPAAAALAASASELEEDVDDDEDSRSRSMSPFKVDLHKKYSKSALNDDLSELLTTVKKAPGGNICMPQDDSDEDDFKSLSSRSSSKSRHSSVDRETKRTPQKSRNVKKTETSPKNTNKTGSASNKKNAEMDAAALAAAEKQAELEMLLPFLDKYELIKYRRSRANNIQPTNTSTVADDSQKGTNNRSRESASKKKDIAKANDKEKLPTKSNNDQSKTRKTSKKTKKDVKDVKEATKPEDVVTASVTEEIPSTTSTSSTPEEKNNSKPVKPETKDDPEDLVDDSPTTTNTNTDKGSKSPDKKTSVGEKISVKKKDKPKTPPAPAAEVENTIKPVEKTVAPVPPKKALQKKVVASTSVNKKTGAKVAGSVVGGAVSGKNSSANIEALDVETEQTLKDINRWLEHTPRFPEFSSASNSPSRYNIDEFDSAISSKLEPSDFRRPVPIAAPKIDLGPTKLAEVLSDLVTDGETAVASGLKKDALSELNPAVGNAASVVVAGTASSVSSSCGTPPHSVASGNSMSSTSVIASSNNSSTTAQSIPTIAATNAVNQPIVLIPPPATVAPSLVPLAPPKPKEPSTTQLLLHPPPPPHIKNQLAKEAKRKTLKEKLQAASNPRRKDLLRTIDRLQPGKAKGNLIQNINKPEELFPLGPVAAKTKEVKNSLIVDTGDNVPKLSLGTVIKTNDFGLGQSHNFIDELASQTENKSIAVVGEKENEEKKNKADVLDINLPFTKSSSLVASITSAYDETEKKDAEVPSIDYVKPFESLLEKKLTSSTDASNGKAPKEKPNLSAWFKAFGAPKKSKKCEEEEKLMQQADVNEGSGSGSTKSNEGASSTSSTGAIAAKSPSSASMMGENFSLPSAPRQRKASTGSTISERSSFSQDPDSPRIAIDERYGSYSGANYTSPIGASPIGASPIMVSPKPDEIGKPTSPYPLNGAIKVGFYQDTTTKSSPDKSCSPREMTSPYPQYSQHIYSSASSPNVSTPELSGTSPYGGANSYNPSGSEASKTPVYSSTSPLPNLYEQYKQPRSQESDYNSSMSPSTPNPNSPYQQPQNSPYTAQPHQSPYHHPNSPYHQQQHSPFHQQAHSPAHTPPSGTAPTGGTSVHSPLQQQQHSPLPSSADSPSSSAATQPPTPLSNSPADQQHSPYQQPVQSPYQQQSQSTPTQQQQQQQHSPQSGQQSQQPQQQDARVQSPYSQSRISPLPYEPRAGTPESVIYDSQQQHDQAGIPTSRATTPTLVIQPMDQRYTQNTTNSSSGSASSRGSPMPTTPTYAPSPQDLFKQQQQTSQQDNLHTIYNASLAGASLTPIIDATKRNDWNVGAQPPQKQTQHHVTGGSQVQQQQSQQHSHQGQQQQQHQQTSQQQHSQSQSQQQQKPQYPTYALYQSKTAAAAQAAATPNREILVSAVGSSGSNSSSSNSSSDKLETNKNTASIYSGIGNIGTDVVAFMQHIHQQAAARQKSISAMVSVVATTGVNTPTTNVANSLKRSAEEMMSGMDYSSGSSAKIVKCENSGRENSGSIQQQLVVQTSKQQQMFDSFMGAMPFGKHLNNIATDKAFEMYSRAAALGFPKDYVKESSSCQMQRQLHQPNPNAAQNHQQQQTLQQLQQKQTQQLHQQQSQAHQQQQTHSPQHHQLQHHSQQQQQSQHQSKANLDSGATSLLNKPLNYGSSSLQQQQLSQQQQQQLSQSYSQQSSNQQQQHIAAKSPTPAAAHDNSGSMSMNMTTHHLAHSHHLSAYNKPTPPPPPPQTYNNPASSLLHPLAESMFGLPSSASYYDKSMPPAAHMYNAAGVAKNLSTTSQLYSNPATAAAAAAAATVAGGMYGNAQQLAGSYMGGSLANSSCSNNATNQQHSAVAVAMETKPTPAPPAPAKRGRKKKASTIAAEAAAAAAAAAKQQQHQQQQQQHQLQHSQQQQSHSQQQQQHASNHLHASSAPTQYSSAAAHIAAQMPTATTVQPAHQSSSVPAHLQAHAQTLQQGFQLYAGLKTGGVSSSLTNPASSASSASSVVASSAASPTAASTSAVSAAAASADVVAAISLKTSASAGMVPGSAFNFGPAPGSLGIYGDQAAAAAASSYLDQFREAPNPYYMSTAPAPAHRNSSNDASSVVEKAQSALNPAAAAATAASAYPFLAAHASSRATPYPFMNTAASQLDPNSQLYQPYLRREEFLMFNQGLLGRTAGAAGYVQPPPPAAYRPSTLGIPKPYDINRPAWF